jgi:hypothetical protein
MSVHLKWVRTLSVVVALGLCLAAQGDDVLAQDTGGTSNNRPVYAFLSVADTFDLPFIEEVNEDLRGAAPFLGSRMIRLKIGTFIAGPSIRTTRFFSTGPAEFDPFLVPPEPGTEDPADFVGNHATIVGSFKTLAPDSTIHLMTPYTQGISAAVQKAFFNASAFIEGSTLSPFPSTVEVALFIYDNQGDAGAPINDILQEIFHVDAAAPVVLESPKPPIVTAEGDLVPHTPAEGTFGFDLDLDLEEGVLDADVVLFVDIDVKPDSNNNTVNVKSDKGVLPIAVMTTDDFDAVNELDPSTVVAVLIGTDGEIVNVVEAERFDIEDVDNDGDDDVTFKFSVPALVDGDNAPLTTTTTLIFFRGETTEGMGVQGSDTVKIVPQK